MTLGLGGTVAKFQTVRQKNHNLQQQQQQQQQQQRDQRILTIGRVAERHLYLDRFN